MTIFIPAWNKGTLEPIEKLEVHRRGLKHKAISIFVFCGGKLLIQQRASNKYHSPELWAIPAVRIPIGAKIQKTVQIDEYSKNLALRT